MSCQRFYKRLFYNGGLWGKCFLGRRGIFRCNTTSGHWEKLDARLYPALVIHPWVFPSQFGWNHAHFRMTSALTAAFPWRPRSCRQNMTATVAWKKAFSKITKILPKDSCFSYTVFIACQMSPVWAGSYYVNTNTRVLFCWPFLVQQNQNPENTKLAKCFEKI